MGFLLSVYHIKSLLNLQSQKKKKKKEKEKEIWGHACYWKTHTPNIQRLSYHHGCFSLLPWAGRAQMKYCRSFCSSWWKPAHGRRISTPLRIVSIPNVKKVIARSFPEWLQQWRITPCQCRRHGFDPWSKEDPTCVNSKPSTEQLSPCAAAIELAASAQPVLKSVLLSKKYATVRSLCAWLG